MVRVGGGWMALDEFLVKNDPCRGIGNDSVLLLMILCDFYLVSVVNSFISCFCAVSVVDIKDVIFNYPPKLKYKSLTAQPPKVGTLL